MSSTVMENNVGSSSGGGRSRRLPRWTRQEILVLVEATQAYEKQCKMGLGRPAKPKWTYVSSWCRREGVDRGPMQCRKRWSNLACDFKKIRSWEGKMSKSREDDEMREYSYWMMRSDVRRERRLPGFFEKEVFEMMEGDQVVVEMEMKEEEEEEEVFDSRRMVREDEQFSEFEEEEEEEEKEEEEEMLAAAGMAEPIVVMPIFERKFQPENEHSDLGNSNDNKQQTDNKNPEKGSTSWEGRKRRRTSEAEAAAAATRLEDKLIEVLTKNSRILSAHLEAQNLNCQLDRNQRKDQTDGLLAVMTKLADALGRIADKL